MSLASTAGSLGLASTIGGGFFSAFGAGKQAQATASQDQYQAAVAHMRAQIDQQNAEYARQTGELQSQQFGLQAGQQMGKIKAAQASSGLDIRSGSAKQVQESQQTLTDIDLDTIRSNAAKTAYSYDVQGAFDTAQAGLFQMAGANTLAALPITEASTMLGTAGSVASKWLQGTQMGLFS